MTNAFFMKCRTDAEMSYSHPPLCEYISLEGVEMVWPLHLFASAWKTPLNRSKAIEKGADPMLMMMGVLPPTIFITKGGKR
jgi:hypothetical protein